MSLIEAIEAQTALLASELPLLRPVVSAGTAFPVGASAGTRFWRIDLALGCYYSGTRWLSDQEYVAQANFPPTASTYNIFIATDNTFNIYLRRFIATYHVATLNDTSNRWRFILSTASNGSAVTERAAFSSSGGIPNVWQTMSFNLATVVETPALIAIGAAKEGTPGLFSGGVMIVYRKIIV